MDFKQLRSFKAVVDYQNFSKAAKKLNMGQSSVSTHILQLERELGTKLLNRTTKTIEITDAGIIAYNYAVRILELEQCVFEACSPDPGRIIRIGASAIPATYILPDLLHQYCKFSSNDHLRLSQCRNKDIVSGVQEGRFDLGLIEHPVEKKGLKCIPLYRNPIVLITPATRRYLEMQQKHVSIRELLKEPVILCDHGEYQHAGIFLENMGIDVTGLNIVARVREPETVKNMVASGLGISPICKIAARNFVQSHRLLQFDLLQIREPNHIYLIYPDGYTSKDSAWNFIDYLLASNELSVKIQ